MTFRHAPFLFVLSALASAPYAAAQTAGNDFKRLTIEELLRIDVTTAARRAVGTSGNDRAVADRPSGYRRLRRVRPVTAAYAAKAPNEAGQRTWNGRDSTTRSLTAMSTV